jgi:hypothetical protein
MDKLPKDPIELLLNGNKMDDSWWELKNKKLTCHSQMGSELTTDDVITLKNLTSGAVVTGSPHRIHAADDPIKLWHLFDLKEIAKLTRWRFDTASVIQAGE